MPEVAALEVRYFGQWAYCGVELTTGHRHDCDEPITQLFAEWFAEVPTLTDPDEFLWPEFRAII